MNQGFATPVDSSKVNLVGPYECSICNGHICLDATYLEQVSESITCPYCKSIIKVEEDEEE